jgi:PAS domain S-box-containing protein
MGEATDKGLIWRVAGEIWQALCAAPAARERPLYAVVSVLIVFAAAIPYAGWMLAAGWLVCMLGLFAASAMVLTPRPGLEVQGGDEGLRADILSCLANAGYAAPAAYLTFFFDGPAQTLGVILFSVVMFQTLARDHAAPRRMRARLLAPIIGVVAVEAAGALLLIQRGHPWKVLTLLAGPYVVFRALRAVYDNLLMAQRRHAEALGELEASQARYQVITDNCPDLIVRYDMDGTIRYVSPSARNFGWDPDVVVGTSVVDMLDPAEQRRREAILADVEAGGDTVAIENVIWRGATPDGRIVAFEGRTRTITDASGHVTGAVSIARDVTEQLALEDELRRKKAEAEAASVAKSKFLATISHEIRTPMNGVLGMVQAMERDKLSRSQRERLGVIRRSGGALLAMLNDVLDLSKIEAGKLELEAHEFDLEELAHGAHAAFTAIASGKGLAFELAVDPQARGLYRGDSVRIRQIIHNLVSNAVKFTEAGQVRVAVSRLGPDVRIAVEDTGIGVPPERIPQLFETFVQADASTTRRFGGTGLGLSISAELAKAMGGDIEVRSVEGDGSTFTARLRLERLSDAPAQRRSVPTALAAPARPDLRVLAAEDNPINRLVLKTVLAQVGVTPALVDDGAAAVAAWRTQDWDLILMDVEMPVMDGPAAAQAIRTGEARAGRARTPIIALTANAMTHQRAEYLASGMDEVVAKPINVAELVAAMNAVLQPLQAAQPPARRRQAKARQP